MLRVLGGKHVEVEVRYRITGDRSVDMSDGRGMGTHTEFRNTASEALATVARFRDQGYLNAQIIDSGTNEPCDEAALARSAAAEGR